MDKQEKYRQKKEIVLNGTDVSPFRKLEDLLQKTVPEIEIQQRLRSLYKKPTPVQAQAIPVILTGRDVLCCSPTGTGKTLSFLLPLFKSFYDLNLTEGKEKTKIGALILSPTKELAHQTFEVACKLSSKLKTSLLCKKYSFEEKIIDILIATPLSLIAQKEKLCFLELRYLVVDEIDQLFDLPILMKQLDQIFSYIPPTAQKMFFSATITKNAEELAKSVMTDPVDVFVGKRNTPVKKVKNHFVFVGKKQDKITCLKKVISDGLKPPVLIFTDSTKKTEEVYNHLLEDGLSVDFAHGAKEKRKLNQTLKDFQEGNVFFLVTTNLLARGIDFKNVGCVLCYDCPQTLETYIHQVGRTARCGKKGDAVILFHKNDKKKLSRISKAIKEKGEDVPVWMLQD